MRMVDADALKESLKNLKAEANNKKYEQGLQDAIDGYFPQIIDDAPTADVQLVKHGRWIPHKITASSKCSECNKVFSNETNYCPYCGARMDGDVNE